MEINWVILGWLIDMTLNGFVWLIIAAVSLLLIDVSDKWTRKAVEVKDYERKFISFVFLSEDEKSATLIEMFEDSDAAKLRLENHSASHLVEEFPEHFEIKQFIVLGDIKSDMKEKLADWNADLRGNIAGFFKGID